LIDGEWQKDVAYEVGDTTNSEVAFYTVTITAPLELDLITSGVEVAVTPSVSEYQSKTFVTGPMRDFAFVLGPFEKIERRVDGVYLNGWVLRGHLEDGETMMDAASQQFSLLSNLVGPYPYPELDIIDVPGGFGGIEYPGLVFIGTLGEVDIIDPTVHEVAHQWFYGLIGNDQLTEPWIDEGASRYGQVLYYENFISSGRATGILNYDRSQLWSHSDPTLPIGLEVGAYDSPRDYVLFVYSKGALFFDQLRSNLGEETFLEFLRTYFEKYRYGFATSVGFQDTAEAVCSCDLDDLFSIWVFEGGEMPLPDG
jgi:aminopeptidase N